MNLVAAINVQPINFVTTALVISLYQIPLYHMETSLAVILRAIMHTAKDMADT